MFCPKCGNNMPDTARVCGKCGNPVAGNAQMRRPTVQGTAGTQFGGNVPQQNQPVPNSAGMQGNIAGIRFDWRGVTFIGGIVYAVLTLIGIIGMYAFRCWKRGKYDFYSLATGLQEADGEWGFGIFMLVVAILLTLVFVGVLFYTATKVLSDDPKAGCSWLGNLAIVGVVSQAIAIFSGISIIGEHSDSGRVGAAPIVWLVIFILLTIVAKYAAYMITSQQTQGTAVQNPPYPPYR